METTGLRACQNTNDPRSDLSLNASYLTGCSLRLLREAIGPLMTSKLEMFDVWGTVWDTVYDADNKQPEPRGSRAEMVEKCFHIG